MVALVVRVPIWGSRLVWRCAVKIDQSDPKKNHTRELLFASASLAEDKALESIGIEDNQPKRSDNTRELLSKEILSGGNDG